MPPLSAYTPFESLLFFQSLATSDVRPASFATISAILSNNPLVRQNSRFSADRLSPDALEDLYATLLRDGFEREMGAGPNGQPTETQSPSNPKKRKISSPLPDELPGGFTHATLIPDLVSHLYARYKDIMTREIRDDERKYKEIKDQVDRLRTEEDKPSSLVAATPPATATAERTDTANVDLKLGFTNTSASVQATTPQAKQPRPIQILEKPIAPAPAPTEVPRQPVPINPAAQTPQIQPPVQSLHAQTVPNPSIQPPLAPRTQHAVPLALATPSTPRAPPHPSQLPSTKASAITQFDSQATQIQSSFQQWQLDPPPHSSYSAISAISPNTVTPQTGPATGKQPAVQPSPLVPSTVPSTPLAAQTTRSVSNSIGRPGISTPNVVIPLSSSRPRLSIDTPGSSTPWKRIPRLSIPHSPTSPARPRPEDVSPISEKAPSGDEMDLSTPRERKTRRGQTAAETESKPLINIKTEKSSTTRGKRAISSASTQSRGLSVLSRDTSPLQEDMVSGRRKGASEQTQKERLKRKRGPSEVLDQESNLSDVPKVETSRYVMCTRGFHRTAAPIMNDVTTHKLASIFAKPLGERDAPGYHDLIYRPQDLKSIKSAVHQGSKAVAAATEAVSTPAGDGESPATSGSPYKNNVLMLPKSEDLMPPKGIVNSAQLEKELIRMFANAIMYNPVPERGFGPTFPMSNDRGSRESTQSADADEGGIIQDSREMFEDVEQAVTRWRAAERTAERAAEEVVNKNILSLRRSSVSDFNGDSADDVKG
ncbi:hypothetical protein N7495_000078 [Penicillium taxi]|uniref:uncharacterized protein n=1 Tax=Penicillium taxi TaxID=168475 RepID=UPI0025454EAE|nr:uncharacterized protein N7495_000078 [Penicillium taxi]KAJ5907396.1 hypothetical protein N7495_000078 [Penicillium taxi]